MVYALTNPERSGVAFAIASWHLESSVTRYCDVFKSRAVVWSFGFDEVEIVKASADSRCPVKCPLIKPSTYVGLSHPPYAFAPCVESPATCNGKIKVETEQKEKCGWGGRNIVRKKCISITFKQEL